MAEHGSASTVVDADFQRRMQQVEALVLELEQASDPRLRERAQSLVRALLDLHKAGLVRILEAIGRTADAAPIVDELAADDLVANILLLHDLHPIPLGVRVDRAIDAVRTRAAKHGADVAIVENGDGRAVVRIAAGSGCGSSVDAIRHMVEEALYKDAPDLAHLEFQAGDLPPAQAFVSLQQLKSYRPSLSSQTSEPAIASTAARAR
jgi:Fe-S cluster biogenesis protein NfuA